MVYKMQPAPDARWWERLCIRIVSVLHPQLVREPERIILAFAVLLTGAGTLLSAKESGSLIAVMPLWLVVEWALALLAGGALTLSGMFTASRWVERFGLALTILGAFVNALALIWVQHSARATIVALIYIAISSAAGIRLIVSTAVNATVPRSGKG